MTDPHVVAVRYRLETDETLEFTSPPPVDWETDVFRMRLAEGVASLEADLIDRRPEPPGTARGVIAISVTSVFGAGVGLDVAEVRVSLSRYPSPPPRFRVSPDVETMWHRYEGYLNQREPLQAMAYFCLTVVESAAGTRNQAARRYGISKNVLGKLGELTGERGDARTARKMRPSQHPLTPKEVTWIEAAVKAIIRRVGEFDPTAPLPAITMADLPPLT